MAATVHVTPLGDLIDHETDVDDGSCVCGPTTVALELGHGLIAWAYVHPSLDGREQAEGD